VTTETAIRDMVGRDMGSFSSKTKAAGGSDTVGGKGWRAAATFSGITFDIHHGEVLVLPGW